MAEFGRLRASQLKLSALAHKSFQSGGTVSGQSSLDHRYWPCRTTRNNPRTHEALPSTFAFEIKGSQRSCLGSAARRLRRSRQDHPTVRDTCILAGTVVERRNQECSAFLKVSFASPIAHYRRIKAESIGQALAASCKYLRPENESPQRLHKMKGNPCQA